MSRGATGLARPEVLFLDVGDTLIRAHPSWAGVYRQGLLESGIDIAEKDLERALLQETQAGGWWLDETPFEPSEAKSFATVVAFDAAVLARLGHADLADGRLPADRGRLRPTLRLVRLPGRDARARRSECAQASGCASSATSCGARRS